MEASGVMSQFVEQLAEMLTQTVKALLPYGMTILGLWIMVTLGPSIFRRLVNKSVEREIDGMFSVRGRSYAYDDDGYWEISREEADEWAAMDAYMAIANPMPERTYDQVSYELEELDADDPDDLRNWDTSNW